MSEGHQDTDQARALLALRAALPVEPVQAGEPASDEELAMLVEGRLPFARKQQVMRQLLVDDTLMRRWLSLTDALQGLAVPASADKPVEPVAAGWWRQWTAWLFSGAASAAALALGLYLGATSGPPPGPASGEVAVTGAAPTTVGTGSKYPGQSLFTTQATAPEVDGTMPMCTSTLHPQQRTQGSLCLMEWLDGDSQRQGLWVWSPRTRSSAGESSRYQLALAAQQNRVLSLSASPGHRWLVVEEEGGNGAKGSRTLLIYRLPDWFGDAGAKPEPIWRVNDPAPAGAGAMRWDGEALLLESRHDFSTDTTGETPRRWRLQPATSEIVPDNE